MELGIFSQQYFERSASINILYQFLLILNKFFIVCMLYMFIYPIIFSSMFCNCSVFIIMLTVFSPSQVAMFKKGAAAVLGISADLCVGFSVKSTLDCLINRPAVYILSSLSVLLLSWFCLDLSFGICCCDKSFFCLFLSCF